MSNIIKEVYTLKKEGEFYTTEILGQNYGFRKWNWGEKSEASNAATQMDQISGFINYDSLKFNLKLITSTVYKRSDDKFVPFTEEEFKALDAQLGERLFQITQKLNLVSQVEAQNL